MRCSVHCPKAARKPAATIAVLAVIALAAYLWMHLWLVAAIAGVAVAAFALSVAVVLVIARIDRGYRIFGAAAPRRLTIRAQTVRLSDTAAEVRKVIPGQPATWPARQTSGKDSDVISITTMPPAPPPRVPLGVPGRPGAVRRLGDRWGGQRAQRRGELP